MDNYYSKEHTARRELFERYWNYYRGNHKKHLRQRQGSPDDNVILNYCRKIVNTGVDFLFGKPIDFSVDGNEFERSEQEQYLDTILAPDPLNGFHYGDLLNDVAVFGAVTGTAFVRLYNTGDIYPDKPALVAINPALVDVTTNPDNIQEPTEYRITWQSGDVWKRDKITRLDNGFWQIVRETRSAKSGRDWQAEDEPVVWPYQWPTIFHCQNLKNPQSFWGDSDLTDADLNDTINFIASNTNRIIKFHAHPRTIGLNISKDQIQATGIDEFWAVNQDGANIYNLEMSSDLGSSLAHLDRLTSSFHQVTATPDLSPDRVQVGALSGFALSILYGPLLAKTEGKRRRYGAMIQRINAALLELGGFGQNIVTEIKWPNPLPVDKAEKAELFGKYIAGRADIFGAAMVSGHTKEEAEQLAASPRMIPDGITGIGGGGGARTIGTLLGGGAGTGTPR